MPDDPLIVALEASPNEYEELLKIALEALKFSPPRYVQSIFGRINTWLPPHRAESEFNILNVWDPLETLDYLVDVTVPAHSHVPDRWVQTFLPPAIQHLFWRPSLYFQQPDPFDSDTSFANEHWFFINGVATNENVAKFNTRLLSKLFRRPVTSVYNATDSILVDLVECAVGKTFKTKPNMKKPQSMTEPAIKATVAILEALQDPQKDKVVVICHSQGTIITANVLRALRRALKHLFRLQQDPECRPSLELEFIDEQALDILQRKEVSKLSKQALNRHLTQLMRKLEVYTFANCADRMTYVTEIPDGQGGRIGLPYIENFANQFDLVARLGVLSPLRANDPKLIKIDGPVFEKTGSQAWGHLLNQHYLFGIEDFLQGDQESVSNPYQPVAGQRQKLPRLYSYFNGIRPPPFYQL